MRFLLVVFAAACLALVAVFTLTPSHSDSFRVTTRRLASGHRPFSTLGQRSAPAASQPIMGAEGQEGPFQVFASPQQKPTVRIGNHSDIPIRFVLRTANGRELTMDIPPQSENVLQADVGHFEAEVFDPRGLIGSAAGDATFQQYHEYRDAFWIADSSGDNSFHIGD